MGERARLTYAIDPLERLKREQEVGDNGGDPQ